MTDARNDYEVIYEGGEPVAVRVRLERRKGPDEWTTVDWVDWPRVKGYRWSVQRSYAVSGCAPVGRLHRFIMHAPEGMDVHHIDGNGFNNRRANLQVLTRSEHALQTYANGEIDPEAIGKGVRRAWANGTYDREAFAETMRKAWANGNHRGMCILTDDEVLEARRLYATGDWTYQQLADKYDVSGNVIYKAVTGRTYKWVPRVAHTTI